MRIALCTPFKPIDHPSISGDVTIARDLLRTLKAMGHDVVPLSSFTAKDIYKKPQHWFKAKKTLQTMMEQAREADCWLTYGSYYKVPDIYGPSAINQLEIPYFIFQASYAANRRKRLATWPGYHLNKRAMLHADHIFCNRVNDMHGCAKILPESKYTYVKPGLPDNLLKRDETARTRLRKQWQVGESSVVLSAAMMRHGVKAEGLKWVIESCAELISKGLDIKLVVAGDGPRRAAIEALARQQLGDRVRFLGMVDRSDLGDVFSAGDLFAFPGLEESVGMVYLEAQLCGLPVIATDDEGAPHVMKDGHSGIVTPVDKKIFTAAIEQLILDAPHRTQLGIQAVGYVKQNHISDVSYQEMGQIMEAAVTAQRQK